MSGVSADPQTQRNNLVLKIQFHQKMTSAVFALITNATKCYVDIKSPYYSPGMLLAYRHVSDEIYIYTDTVKLSTNQQTLNNYRPTNDLN